MASRPPNDVAAQARAAARSARENAGLPSGFRLARPEERLPIPPELQPQARPVRARPDSEGGGVLDWITRVPTPGEAARSLYLGVGDVAEGAGDLLGLLANPINAGLNLTGLPQRIIGRPLGTDLGADARAITGAPDPANMQERLTGALVQGATGGLAGGAVASGARNAPGVAGQFLRFLGEEPMVEIAAGAGGGVASELAREAGAPGWLQLAAGLAGGTAAGISVPHGRTAPRLPDSDFVTTTLDGVAPDLATILRSGGVTDAQIAAMSPDFAERAAGAIQARNAAMIGDAAPMRPVGTGPSVVFGQDSAPGIRNDDLGGIVGEARFRAGMEEVLARAESRAADNPAVRSVLESAANMQQQAASVFRMLQRNGEQQAPLPTTMPQDIQGMSIDRSTGAVRVPPDRRARTGSVERDFDRMLVREGGTNRDGSFRTSPAGAIGPAQVMPGTGPEAARLAGLEWDEHRYRTDHDYNVALGRAYHREMVRQFGGDRRMAAAAYNAGPGRVRSAIRSARRRGGSWEQYLPDETRAYVEFVFNGEGRTAPAPREDAPYRAPDETEFRRRREQAGDLPLERRDRGFEDTSAPQSPTRRQMEDGAYFEQPNGTFGHGRGRSYEAPMATAEDGLARRAATDDPAGQPGFWERRAEMRAEELRQEWERSQAEQRASANERRAADAQARAGEGDASQRYRGKYDQRPHMDGDYWRFTDDGLVAGRNGNPVAFRSARDAAKWAAGNRMGGDVEPAVWSANSARVVLRRRDGSTYGQRPADASGATTAADAPSSAARFTRTEFERTRPRAGRRPGDPVEQIGQAESAVGDGGDAPSMPEGAFQQSAPYREATGESGGGFSRSEEVVTAAGMRMPTRFEVVEANSLITSDNPRFDRRFQPRDRATRASSDAQIAEIASRLDPKQLTSSRLASQGAPIVRGDGTVMSGNGRTAAIRRAYEVVPERAAAYRAEIERLGFDTSGMERPMIVRRGPDDWNDAQWEQFSREAQSGGTMRMSAGEQAKVDARALPDEVLSSYRGGDLNAAGNRDFVRKYVQSIVDPADHNAMFQSNGALSTEGLARLRAGMLARAFDNPALIEKIVSDPDTDIRALGNVLTDIAPSFAVLKARVAAGELPPQFDITPQVAEMADIVARSRRDRHSVAAILDQSDWLSGGVDPITRAVAGLMMRAEPGSTVLTKARNAAQVREGLQFYVDDAIATGPDMFGDNSARALQIVQTAEQKLKQQDNPDPTFFDRSARPGESSAPMEGRQPLRERLASIARTGTEEQADLALRLRDALPDGAELVVGRDGLRDVRNRGEAEVGTMRAFARDAGDVETILHEAVHLASQRRFGIEFADLKPGDTGPGRDFLTLFNEARSRFASGSRALAGRDVRYALSSADEFLAMAMTNRSVQRFLEGGGLWNRVIDGIRRIIGLEPRWRPMLADVLSTGREVISAPARSDAPSADHRSFNPGLESLIDKVIDRDGMRRDAERVRAAVGNPITTLRSIMAKPREFVSALTFSNDARLRALGERHNSAAIREYADIWHARAGEADATRRTYHEAVQRESATRLDRAYEALKPFAQDEAALRRIQDLLRFPNRTQRAKPDEIAAAQSIRDLLKETIDYRRAAGEDIGEVSDGYFPRMINAELVVSRAEEFKAKAERLYRMLDAEDPARSANDWFEHVFDTYAGLDGGLEFMRPSAGGAGSQTAKARQFGKAADELLADFYEQDTLGALASYITGAARRAEHQRRFGAKGAVGSPEREAWRQEHGDQTQWDVLSGRMRDDLRSSDADAAGAMELIGAIHKSNLGLLGAGIGRSWRGTIGTMHAWNQLMHLDRTTVTSLSELASGFIRGGPRYGFQFVGNSLTEFARQLRGAERSEAERWAAAVGVGQDAMVSQMLLSRSGIEGMSNRTQRVLAGFHKATLLHQFTEGTRTAAVTMGRHYLSTLAGDLASKNARVSRRARTLLSELGISDPARFAETVRGNRLSIDDVMNDRGEHAAEYATALIRFVNQTIMNPSRAEKPTLASHPVGSLFYSLLSWSYGFKKNVLDRTARLGARAIRDRDPAYLAPAAGLAVMAAFTYANDTYLRPTLFGSNYDFDSETASEALLRTADRAGLTGALSPVINAFRGLKYQRSFAESVAGPAIGTALGSAQKVGNAMFGRNARGTNTAERNAAGAIYDAAIEPALDALASARFKGIAATAGVLSTGNREGSLLPEDRDWFVDTVAGERSD